MGTLFKYSYDLKILPRNCKEKWRPIFHCRQRPRGNNKYGRLQRRQDAAATTAFSLLGGSWGGGEDEETNTEGADHTHALTHYIRTHLP